MKKILLTSLIFIFQSFYSFGSDDWIEFGKTSKGNTFYYKNVKFFDGYKYFEKMVDYLEPTEDGTMCGYTYVKVNCNNFSFKMLKFQFYTRPLCKGKGKFSEETIQMTLPKIDWKFNKPGQMDYVLSKYICTNQR